MNERLPCLLHEDEHLLVVDKPPGLNTHAPSPFAGPGLYDWLRDREPRWDRLAIVHRLDKETSGVLVFSKTSLANRSLTEQFTRRQVRKKYLFLTDRTVPTAPKERVVRSQIVRLGDHYASRPGQGGLAAETHFVLLGAEPDGRIRMQAEPVTGRTHQIRVHAAESGFPILGDVRYGGSAAARLYLHAGEVTLQHPATGEALTFRAPERFGAVPSLALRQALIDPELTDAYRLIHGASDGWPQWYVERWGEFLLASSARPEAPPPACRAHLEWLRTQERGRGAYHKSPLRPGPHSGEPPPAAELILGEPAPPEFEVRENGLRFGVRFGEGASVGLFLDQRDNRRRLLTRHVGAEFPLYRSGRPAPEVLNTFAYTCAFSVCAAKGGARTTSIDLSKKALEWGQANFRRNGLDPEAHAFLNGDVFDWLRRFGKRERRFDVILLDPPTFSRSKAHGIFRVEADYGRLVSLALPLLRPGGVFFASTNFAALKPERFLELLHVAVSAAGRAVRQELYVAQPPDFHASRGEPAYLKTHWMRLDT